LNSRPVLVYTVFPIWFPRLSRNTKAGVPITLNRFAMDLFVAKSSLRNVKSSSLFFTSGSRRTVREIFLQLVHSGEVKSRMMGLSLSATTLSRST